jgi:transcriptional regulator with XRE-family HTH domain
MLGEFLIAARRRRHLSQATLAQRAGITGSYLSEIEKNGHIPSRTVLRALARGLELPESLLIALLYPDEADEAEEVALCVET